MDMERALKHAKMELAAKGGNQLAKQWEVQKAVGMSHLVVNWHQVDHRHVRQLSCRSRFVCRLVAMEYPLSLLTEATLGFQSYKQMVLDQSAEKFSVPCESGRTSPANCLHGSSQHRHLCLILVVLYRAVQNHNYDLHPWLVLNLHMHVPLTDSHSLQRRSSFNLERTLQIAHQSLNE
jgi:hypothetical protein